MQATTWSWNGGGYSEFRGATPSINDQGLITGWHIWYNGLIPYPDSYYFVSYALCARLREPGGWLRKTWGGSTDVRSTLPVGANFHYRVLVGNDGSEEKSLRFTDDLPPFLTFTRTEYVSSSADTIIVGNPVDSCSYSALSYQLTCEFDLPPNTSTVFDIYGSINNCGGPSDPPESRNIKISGFLFDITTGQSADSNDLWIGCYTP